MCQYAGAIRRTVVAFREGSCLNDKTILIRLSRRAHHEPSYALRVKVGHINADANSLQFDSIRARI